MLGLQNEREWQAFCAQVLQRPEVASDPRFCSNAQRNAHRAELQALIVQGFAALSGAQVVERLDSPTQTLIDARGAPRYRGEVEPLDPIAGHIPGALNRPFTDNLTADGHFKSAEQLKQEFGERLGGRDPASVVHHCGSGVSTVPNIIAMELAGYPPVGLYAGSWSEWSRTPGLPVAKG